VRILVLLLVVAAVGGAVLAILQARATGLAARHATDPADFQNHLDMARLLERLMENDFVRGVIPEAEQRTARRVLREYYGEDDEKEIGR
jgi:hypothetical protein